MEYEKRIKELLDAVSTLLESNNELLAQRKRSRYGKSGEKSHDSLVPKTTEWLD